MAVLVALLAVVVTLLAVLVAGLLRGQGEILRSLRGLGAGLDADPAVATQQAVVVPRTEARGAPRETPDVVGVSPTGDAISIAVSGAPHATLVAFLTSTCTMCAEFWSAFADATHHPVPGDARVVIVTKGEEAESSARLRPLAPAGVPVVMSSPTWDAYDAEFAPHFAYVDGPSAQIVGEGFAATWDEMVAMVRKARADAGIGSAS
ncbi:MAG: hypothetical protein MUP97_00090 [Acidimicrobiia bacterium]|nr:hypothetical protein [Acidimicrobiia bacterium]